MGAHKQGTLARKASIHGVTIAVRDHLYQTLGDTKSVAALAQEIQRGRKLIIDGFEMQAEGEIPWHTGEPWGEITTTDSIHEECDEAPAIRLTEAGKRAAEASIEQVDPAFQTSNGPTTQRSV